MRNEEISGNIKELLEVEKFPFLLAGLEKIVQENFVKRLDDYGKVKNMLLLRLVAKPCPEGISAPYMDLYMEVYVQVRDIVVTVKENYLTQWGKSKEEVLSQAKQNTEKLPVFCQNITRILFGNWEDLFEPLPMSALKYNIPVYGASILMNTEVLAEIRKDMERDFYICPSSVHEVLIAIPKEGETEEACQFSLKKAIKEVNQEQLSEEEKLSDNLYKYCGDKKEVIIC
ncbi:DUF5688 family protein [Blautia sp.]|uniref:DUF5688 family protein n=1 Tax=Blautia sp. TaxID=1955243 RepID=UPI00258A6EC9|nr:DUF5688 family protein [Blautia sp.]